MSFPNRAYFGALCHHELSFNPCFSGCPSRTQAEREKEKGINQVSILVLVDVLPELYQGKYYLKFL